MDTKEARPFSPEELEQIKKAIDEFGGISVNEPQHKGTMPQQETIEPLPKLSVNENAKPVQRRTLKVNRKIIAVIAVLALVFGYHNWRKLPLNHPNSMVNRKQTITASQEYCMGIYEGGLPFREDIDFGTGRWAELEAMSANANHVVGIRRNGDVLFSGKYAYGGKCVTWENVTAVSAGRWHTVGLLESGTVLAAGNNDYGQCEVDHWQDVAGISAGYYFTAGLRADGTVVLTQIVSPQGKSVSGAHEKVVLEAMQQSLKSVSAWRNILAISAGDTYLLGLKSDGTVVSAGYCQWGQCDVQAWTDVVSISAGPFMSVGVRNNGTFVVSGMLYYYGTKDGEQFPYREVVMEMLGKKIVAATSNEKALYLLDAEGTIHKFFCDPIRFNEVLHKEIATRIRIP